MQAALLGSSKAQISPRPRVNRLRSEGAEWRRHRDFGHEVRSDDDRAAVVAGWAQRDSHRVVKFYPRGALVRVEGMPSPVDYEGSKGGGKRGKIESFSARSRAAMLRLVAKLPQAERPILLTLTYPRVWPGDPRQWKRDLDAFGKALRRAHPGVAMIWKLEPQKRGAPHYHAMIYGADFVPLVWLRETWFRIVGSGDEKHLTAGTKVERARSGKAAMAYASKAYMGKQSEIPAAWDGCGRIWGVIGRKDLPIVECVEVVVSLSTLARYLRAIRGWQKSKGMKQRTCGTISVFTTQHLQFCRLLGWAAREAVESMSADAGGGVKWGS